MSDVSGKLLKDYEATPLKGAEVISVGEGELMSPPITEAPSINPINQTMGNDQSSSGEMRNIPSSNARPHPFKIEVVTEDSNLLLQVYYGVSISTQTIFDSGDEHINPVSSIPTINGGFLVGDPSDPDGDGVGQFTLSSNKTYGVWVSTARSFIDSSASPLDTLTFSGLQLFTFSSAPPQVFISEDRKDASDYSSLITDNRLLGYIYLGKVAIAANGDVEITQYQQSDIVWPCIAFPLNEP